MIATQLFYTFVEVAEELEMKTERVSELVRAWRLPLVRKRGENGYYRFCITADDFEVFRANAKECGFID